MTIKTVGDFKRLVANISQEYDDKPLCCVRVNNYDGNIELVHPDYARGACIQGTDDVSEPHKPIPPQETQAHNRTRYRKNIFSQRKRRSPT